MTLVVDRAQGGSSRTDEQCFGCGYPFDAGDRVLRDQDSGKVYCSRTCAKVSRQ
jgi:hypothetical protein